MKTTIFLWLLVCYYSFSQVGIGTTDPKATLDINGNLRIRTTTTNPSAASAKDSVLVVNANGDVGRVSAQKIVNSYLKTFIKGRFATTAVHPITIAAGTEKIIAFDSKEFDTNNEFNTSTYTFTASQAGIYSVWVQIKAGGSVAVATDFGVAIAKNGVIIARNNFANVGINLGFLGTINATPPLRNTTTLVELNAGETVSFYVISSLATVNVIGTSEDTFFTIEHVR